MNAKTPPAPPLGRSGSIMAYVSTRNMCKQKGYICHVYNCMYIYVNKHVRCNPDVAPRLTSGGYEDKVDVITPINILVDEGVCPAFTRLVSSGLSTCKVHMIENELFVVGKWPFSQMSVMCNGCQFCLAVST